MTLKFQKLTRLNMRALKGGQSLCEHGIVFDRLNDGDGSYSINIMVDGKRIHRAVGKESAGVTRQQVEELIAKLRTDARQGRLNLPKGRKLAVSFKVASENYIEKLKAEGGKDIPKKYERLHLHLTPFFNDMPLSKITTFDIERYKKHRVSLNARNGTLNRELSVLSHLLNKAVEWQWLEYNRCKVKRLPEESGRITYLTQEQISRLIGVAKADQNIHIYPFIVIGLSTSMRRMEILSIKLQHIDVNKRVIYIPQAKAGPREQPITQSLADFLKGYIAAAEPGQEWLFASSTSSTGYMMNIEKPFRRVVAATGLDPKQVVRHTLRHTAITHLVQAGVDLPTVQRISGHKSLQMVVRYSHQNGTHIKSAMDKLERQYSLKENKPIDLQNYLKNKVNKSIV